MVPFWEMDIWYSVKEYSTANEIIRLWSKLPNAVTDQWLNIKTIVKCHNKTIPTVNTRKFGYDRRFLDTGNTSTVQKWDI